DQPAGLGRAGARAATLPLVLRPGLERGLRLLSRPPAPCRRGARSGRRGRPVNPRQRRGVLFLLAAAALSVAVFLAVSNYVSGIESQVGPRVTVYRVSEPIEAYQPLGASNVEAFEVPR